MSVTAMSKKKVKDKMDKGNVGGKDDAVKSNASGLSPDECLPAQTFDDYQCLGSVETDFPELCALLGVREIPAVNTKQPASPPTCETDGENTDTRDTSQVLATSEDCQRSESTTPLWSKPCLQVELENEDPQSAWTMKVIGWKIDEQIAGVLNRMLPSLSNLQSLQFWQAGLTDPMVISLQNTITLCSNLRSVKLEGNPLPEQSYHLLLSRDSPLSHLFLRNNQIGDEGARLIGSALSTARSANKNLLSLNLAFNHIGDEGAAHIAKGLRLNRALRFLSLSNNQIGDSGASHLATILGQFALTGEEAAERKRLLEGGQSEADAEDAVGNRPFSACSGSSLSTTKGIARKKDTPKKEDKAAAKKGNPKSSKKSDDRNAPQKKGGKSGNKEKQQSALEQELERVVVVVNPLLEESVQHRDGQVILLGNTALTSLNLAGNRITERPLPLFLSSVQMQAEGGGLLRLCLQRNRFPPDCESYVKIQEVMTLRDPLNKPTVGETEEEEQDT